MLKDQLNKKINTLYSDGKRQFNDLTRRERRELVSDLMLIHGEQSYWNLKGSCHYSLSKEVWVALFNFFATKASPLASHELLQVLDELLIDGTVAQGPLIGGTIDELFDNEREKRLDNLF